MSFVLLFRSLRQYMSYSPGKKYTCMISKDTKSKCTNLSWFLKNVIRQSADLITLDKKKVKPSEDNLLPPTPPPPPPNNPINERTLSLGPRLSLFSEKSYKLGLASVIFSFFNILIWILIFACCYMYNEKFKGTQLKRKNKRTVNCWFRCRGK